MNSMTNSQVFCHLISRRARSIFVGIIAVAALFGLGALSYNPALAAEMQDETLVFSEARGAPGKGWPNVWTESPHSYWLWPLYDSLVMLNNEGKIVPLLAESWTNVDDLTWHYRLRPNIEFQNGEPFTAEAVVQMLDWLFTDEGKVGSAGQVLHGTSLVASARAIDDLTLEFRTKVPNPVLPRSIGRFWIPAPKAWRESEQADFALNPVGTGPYRVVEWKPEAVDYEAWDGSWRPARIARLRGVIIPDMTARRSAIISGQVDIAVGLSIDDIALVEESGNRVDVAPRPTAMTLKLFQTSRESPFNDKRVRQAANYALDKDAMVTHIMRGHSRPVSQCAVQESFGFNADVKPYAYDPDRAKQLLAEAGYPNGFDTVIQAVLPSTFPGATDVYHFVAQQLTEVGIKVDLQAMSFPDWIKAWRSPANTETLGFAGPFQNNCNNFNLDGLDGFAIQSCRKKPSFYCVPEEEELLARASQEMDIDKREQLVRELLAMNAENASTIMLVQLVDIFGLSKRLQGFENHTMRLNYHEMSVAE